MFVGMLSGLFWAIETILIGSVMELDCMQALYITPFICTFFHDFSSALWIGLYNLFKGHNLDFKCLIHSRDAKYVALAAMVGGPVGMSGYMMTIHYLGSSIGAVVSAIFPAVGAVLAVIFLKEKMRWYQWIFLFMTLLGVYGINFTSDINVVNVWMGLLGAVLCSFGWGLEAVILAKKLKEEHANDACVLQIRQMTSACVYGLVLFPLISKMNISLHIFNGKVLVQLGFAALFATLSYLFYYKAIAKIGASKAMALNISYVAWAMFLPAVLFGNFTSLTPFTVVCAMVVFVCGVLTTFDFKKVNV